jgi:hypothetical protein
MREPPRRPNQFRNLNVLAAYHAIDRSTNQELLLPPLRAPNDPELMQALKQKKREMDRKKWEYQKRNAEATLAKYSLDLPEERTGTAMMVTDLNGMRVLDQTVEVSENQAELKGEISSPTLEAALPRINRSFLDN